MTANNAMERDVFSVTRYALHSKTPLMAGVRDHFMSLPQISTRVLLQIEHIEKFYAAYQSALVFYRPERIGDNTAGLPEHIRNQLSRGNIPVVLRDTPPEPDEPDQVPDGLIFDTGDLKRYMLDHGQREIFENSLILLFNSIEGFVRSRIEAIESKEFKGYVTPESLERAGITGPAEATEGLFILREARNAFVHNESIWDAKAAAKLSKMLTGTADETYPLTLKTLQGKTLAFNVENRISLALDGTAVFRWFTAQMKALIAGVDCDL